jgi:hypothetical protein
MRLLLRLFICGALGVSAHAGGITWGGVTATVPTAYQTSTGAPMTSAFVFELGVFSVGFDPNEQPIDSWAANWTAAHRTYYATIQSGPSTVYRGFSSYANPSNAAPFSVGRQGYIWVRNAKVGGAEWALFTADSWFWPASDPSPNVAWQFSDPGLLEIASSGSRPGRQLQTAAVSIAAAVPLPWAVWQSVYLSSSALTAAQKLPGADPDGDGATNLREYAFATDPTFARSVPPPLTAGVTTVGGQRFVTLTAARNATAFLNWTGERSTDLTGWLAGPTHTMTTGNNPDEWSIRDAQPATGARAFMRLKITLPP